MGKLRGAKGQKAFVTSSPLNTKDIWQQAVAAAKDAWGVKALEELDAEERLSFACEKAATEDKITLMLRSAFKVRLENIELSCFTFMGVLP